MAKLIQAIKKYCPRIKLGKTVQLQESIEYISGRTGLNKGELRMVLSELSDMIIFFNKRGRGVKLEGIGTFHPSIDMNGKISVSQTLDMEISNALNIPGEFIGDIQNKENIGKTSAELVEMWNKEFPADPIT